MFYKKIALFIIGISFVVCSVWFINRRYNKDNLEGFIKQININEFETSCLIIESSDYDVSIDPIIFKLEFDKMIKNINKDLKVEYIKLNRYSSNIKLRIKYKGVEKIVEYELIKNTQN